MVTSDRKLEYDLIEEFGTATFSEQNPTHKALGWSGGYDDQRDWQLSDRIRIATLERQSGRQLWSNPLQLNQGREGACVGFGHTGVANSAPTVHEYGNDYGFFIYNLAQSRYDPWPGINYEGTTLRAGAMAMRQEGHYQGFAFTQNVVELAVFVLNKGPATIAVDWYEGMDRVDSEGFIHPTGRKRGGHCVVIDGVTYNFATVTPNRFRIRNSWGLSWGFNGRCRISFADLAKLFQAGGAACCALEVG